MLEEFESILREAIASVEQSLQLEDSGWINLSRGKEVISPQERIATIAKARLYAIKDPLAMRSVRLMTDYSFGTGLSWNCKDEEVKEALSSFWDSPQNYNVLSPIGQRKSSDKLLVDGELFFALFLGSNGAATIRRIDPLEITEIISNPDDLEDVRYYKREWSNAQGIPKVAYYKSCGNQKDLAAPDFAGKSITATEDALVYHVPINDLSGQRGNSYLLPALQWIELYRKFLASRVAIMLALARFAWKVKVQGGTQAVAAAKATYNEKEVPAASMAIENLGADLQPIRTDTGAANAYQDGRMLKLQVSAAVGWPEQYFGDISIGNLATAKTVELPVMKMCQSYQTLWHGVYDRIDNIVLGHADIAEDKRYVDRDFPDITPEDAASLALAIQQMVMTFPEFTSSRDVLQKALLTIGIQNTNEVLDQIGKESKGMPEVALAKALRDFREVLGDGHKKYGGLT